MSETSKIVQTQTGYSFNYSVEKETRMQGADPKYSDKALATAKLSGNTETWEAGIQKLQEAKREVQKALGSSGDEKP